MMHPCLMYVHQHAMQHISTGQRNKKLSLIDLTRQLPQGPGIHPLDWGLASQQASVAHCSSTPLWPWAQKRL